ncbi:MAG: hypothetical protein KBD31_00385 [Proteobacteria bacterium]|nr:hypothetical protein [Pseudomonadota bacterium]
MKKNIILTTIIISIIKLKASDNDVVFNPVIIHEDSHAAIVGEEKSSLEYRLLPLKLLEEESSLESQLSPLRLSRDQNKDIVDFFEGTKKKISDTFVEICLLYTKFMTDEQKKGFVSKLMEIPFIKYEIILENKNISKFFDAKNKTEILDFIKRIENKYAKQIMAYFNLEGVILSPESVIIRQKNLFNEIHLLYNFELLDFFKKIKPQNFEIFINWIDKLSTIKFGPKVEKTHFYKMVMSIFKLDSDRPILPTENNFQIFNACYAAQNELFSSCLRNNLFTPHLQVIKNIEFEFFHMVTDFFIFLNPIVRKPFNIRHYDFEFNNLFKMLDEQSYQTMKDVVRLSALSDDLVILFSLIIFLGKDHLQTLENILQRYERFFSYVPIYSAYDSIKNLGNNTTDISTELLEQEFEYLHENYFHNANLNREEQDELLVNRLQGHPFFAEGFQIHNYYNQMINFHEKTISLSTAILEVLEQENLEKKYYGISFIRKTLSRFRQQNIPYFFRTIKNVRGGKDLLTSVFSYLYKGDQNEDNLQLWFISLMNESLDAFTGQNERSCREGLFERMLSSLRYISHGNAELDNIFKQGEKLLIIKNKIQNINCNWSQKAFEFGIRTYSSPIDVSKKIKKIILNYLDLEDGDSIIAINWSVKSVFDALLEHCVENIFPEIKGELESYEYLEILLSRNTI